MTFNRRDALTDSDSGLSIRLLGDFEVSVGANPIPRAAWARKRAAALVKLLALAPGHARHREQVLDTLWPDLDPSSAANNLHYTVHRTRQILGSRRYVTVSADRLALGPCVTTDVEAFEDAAAAARLQPTPTAYERALALYRGELLPGDLYEDWVESRRAALRRLYVSLLMELAEVHESHGALLPAAEALRRVLAEDRTIEEAHVRLMRVLAASGNRRGALQQFHELEEALREELDVEPEPASVALWKSISEAGSPARANLPPMPERTEPSHNLPAVLSSFVGRDEDMSALEGLVRTSRLVTIAGPGGAGKTRTALQVGRCLLAEFPDGAWLVELAPLSEEGAIARHIAEALGVPERPDQPALHTLVEALSARQTLIILDNCEHLVAECASIAEELLRRCEGLRLLVTSREPLRIRGEATYQLEPLALPDRALTTLEEIARSPSVQLFVDRAAERVRFVLDETNAVPVAEVCRQVAGIPLGIELAAARITVLSPSQIAERLADSLKLLTDGARTWQPRQQTMRGAIEWSYRLLDDVEQPLFAALAVFAGGWALDAAEAVGDVADALEPLSRLVDKSLVTVDRTGDVARYGYLEPIRQYAAEKLTERGLDALAHRRHLMYMIEFAEHALTMLAGREQRDWFDRIEMEHDNIRAALHWSLHHECAEQGLWLASTLWLFWYTRGHVHEGIQWLQTFLGVTNEEQSAIRARALRGLGTLLYKQRSYRDAEQLMRAAADIYTSLDDQSNVASCLTNLASILLEQGDIDQAMALNQRALVVRRDTGDVLGAAIVLSNLGTIAFAIGDHAGARAMLEEGLEGYRQVGDLASEAIGLNNLGEVAMAQGDVARGEALCHEALRVAVPIGEIEVMASSMDVLGRVAALRGDPWRAARLHGAADGILEDAGFSFHARESEDRNLHIQRVRETLGDAGFHQAWSEGKGLDADAAAAYALESVPSIRQHDVLSSREREIADLASNGLSNREIAGRLGISERTVDTHVRNVLQKLGLSRRSEIGDRLPARRRDVG